MNRVITVVLDRPALPQAARIATPTTLTTATCRPRLHLHARRSVRSRWFTCRGR